MLRRTSFLVVVLLCCARLSSLAQSSATDETQSLMHQGSAAMRAGNAAAAEAAFRKATVASPNLAAAWLDMGLAELKQGKLAGSISDIHKALTLDPNAPGAHLFLGIAEYQTSRPDQAIADLQQAVKDDPTNEQAYTWLGIVELNTGHPEKAVGPLDRAAELNPKDENVLDYRVQAHLAVAKQSYGQIYKLDPTSWRLHQLDAVIDSQAGDHQHAVEDYQKAIKISPRQAALYEAMGWEYRALNENALAVKAFTEQLKLAPGNPIAMYNLASSEAEAGDAQQALPLLEEVVKLYRLPSQADYYLGRVLESLGRYKEAAAEFQRATELRGELQLRSWYELSHIYRRLGEQAKAREAVLKYQALKRQSEQASGRSVQDFLKLNQANAAATHNKQQ
ncbi:MAG: tetratricopeptide repeat protein [Acidobacteriaceae bacterium]